MFIGFLIGFISAIISLIFILIRVKKGKKIGLPLILSLILSIFIFGGAIGYNTNNEEKSVTNNTAVTAQTQAQPKIQEQPNQQAQPVKIEQKTAKSNTETTTQAQTYKVLNSVEELQSRFNPNSDKYQLGFKINNTNIKPGQVQDVFQCMLNQYIGLNCAINKSDKSIRSVGMIAHGGDGSSKSAAEVLVTIGTLIGTIDPSLSVDNISQITKDLGLHQSDLMGLKKTVTKNNLTYGVDISKEVGIYFYIQSANDK